MFEKTIEALHGYLVFFFCAHGCFSTQGIKVHLRCFSCVLKPGPDHQLARPVELSIHTSYGLAWPLRPVLLKNWSEHAWVAWLTLEPESTGHNCLLALQARPILAFHTHGQLNWIPEACKLIVNHWAVQLLPGSRLVYPKRSTVDMNKNIFQLFLCVTLLLFQCSISTMKFLVMIIAYPCHSYSLLLLLFEVLFIHCVQRNMISQHEITQ